MGLSLIEFASFVLVFISVLVGLAIWLYMEGSALSQLMQKRLNAVILDRNQLSAKNSILLTKYEKKCIELKQRLASPSTPDESSPKLETELGETKSELESLKKELKLSEKFADELQKQIKQREEELIKASHDISELKESNDKADTEKSADLLRNLEEKQSKLSKMKKENGELKQKVKELSFQIENIEKAHAKDLNQLLEKVEKDKAVLRDKYNKKIKKLKSQDSQTSVTSGESDIFEKKLVQRILKSYKRLMSLEKENISLKNKLQGKEKELEEFDSVHNFSKMTLMERATLTLWSSQQADENTDEEQLAELKKSLDQARKQIHNLQKEKEFDDEKTVA